MKFYVVESNSKTGKINVKAKKCFKSDNLTTAYAKYSIAVKNKEAKHIYLIADFEDRSFSIFHNIKLNNHDDPWLPFFVIADYYSDLGFINPEKTIRNDKTRIISDGFIREFNNNFSAIRSYVSKIQEDESDYDIEFCISYKVTCKVDDKFILKNVKKGIVVPGTDDIIYTRTIDNSTRMKLFDKHYSVKRFKFYDDLDYWNSEF